MAAPPGGGCFEPGAFSRPGMRTGEKPSTRRGLTPEAGSPVIMNLLKRGSSRRARSVAARNAFSGGSRSASGSMANW
jgi:hypothetical protein